MRKLTGLYKTERMGQARYTRRDLDGAQGKPAANLRVLVRLQISKLGTLSKKKGYYLGIFPKRRTHPPLLGTPYPKKIFSVYFAF